MPTGPDGVPNAIPSSVGEAGTYEVESSILPSGVSRSGDESEEWGRADGLTYEESDLPGTTHSGKKTFTSSRRQ